MAAVLPAVDARALQATVKGKGKGKRGDRKGRLGSGRVRRNMRDGRRTEAETSREEWTDERNGEKLSVGACV